MKVIAKCRNYSGCLLAYRGEDVELEKEAPLVCPECGKALTIEKPRRGGAGQILGPLIFLAVLAAGVYFAWPYIEPKLQEARRTGAEKPAAATPTPAPSAVAPTPAPQPTVSAPAAEPPQEIVAPAKIDFNVATSETKKVKDEVLTRIDVMPNVSQANKDRLYASVERARSMGKVITIPFGSGKTGLTATDVQALKNQLDSPDVRKLRDEPTAVFVILGYADPKGDKQKNIAISQTRADAVLAAMRDKCGVINVMHAVAMGGSTLLDAKNIEKNRIVEVWAVLP